MKTNNIETKISAEGREMYVCSICGELHPKRFMQKRRGRQGYICCSCAYECYACQYGEAHINPIPYLASLRNGNLSRHEAKRIAKQYAGNFKENHLQMNEFDDYRNVFATMVNYLKSGYEGTIEKLYEEVCEDASRSKFERRCKHYFDMEALFKMYGEVNYDNFDEVFLPSTKNPSVVHKMFKLVQLDRAEILASVYHMLNVA